MILGLDHVNLRTEQLDVMIAWYEETLQLKRGPRPSFGFPGAWLYAGDAPLVHLSEVDTARPGGTDLTLEHAAFRAKGMAEFVARLEAGGQRYRLSPVPDFPTVQVNIWDPDGNHLHVDFDRDEAEAAGLV